MNEEILNLNTTASAGMSPVMEAVLNRYVLENNKTKRKYVQFGQKVTIPKGKTKTISFDKMSPLPIASKPLTEGITPRGSAVNITRINVEPEQYGNYISYTDQLDFFAHDPSPEVLKYTELLKENQLETFEKMDAMTLAAGLNVEYAGAAASRNALTDVLTVSDIRRAVTHLKANKVQGAAGSDFICFIHPNVVNDIWSDDEWRKPHDYADTTQIYTGEIGKLFGVRFIEDPESYVFRGTPFGADGQYNELTVVSVATDVISIAETITSEDVIAFNSKEVKDEVYINGHKLRPVMLTAGSNGQASITFGIDPTTMAQYGIEPGMKIYPGDGAVNGKPVYSTIIVGKNAYGTTGDGNVELINKSLGSAGTADPLNQRGTYGWKGYNATKIIEQTKMVRIESLASIDG